MQQHPQEASNISVVNATRDATTTQRPPKKHATNVQQNLNRHATNKTVATVATVASVAVAKPEGEKITEVEIELIRAWLFKIGEPEENHYLVLDKCRRDKDAMQYFLRQASNVATVAIANS